MLTRPWIPASIDWLFVLSFGVIDAVLFCIGPMDLVWQPEAIILLAALALVGLGWVCERTYSSAPHLAHMAHMGCFIILFTNAAVVFNYLADGLGPLPLWDQYFNALDRVIGLDWLALYDWVTAHPTVYYLSFRLYGLLTVEFLSLLLLLEAVGEHKQALALRHGYCVAVIITIMVGVLMPASGPFVFYDLPVADETDYVAQMAALRDGTLRQIDLANAQGLVVFPSFHATLAVLCAHAARAVRGLFWPALLINVLIIGTTPIIGGHYFVDIVAGLALAGFVIFINGLVPAASGKPLR